MSRSNWKGNFIHKSLLVKKQKNLKVWCRSSIIPSNLIGFSVLVHNGKEFKKIMISREKVGFRFGDFSFTRKYNHKYSDVKSKRLKKKR